MRRADRFDKAVRAHTNLNAFNSLISILEGGNIYGGNPRTDRAAQKIIGICKVEMQHLLREHDNARDDALSPNTPEHQP